MRNAVLVGLVIACLAVPAAAQRDVSEADRRAIQQVLDKYIESVNAADLALAGDVWSRGADVIAVTPFGRFQGWASVRDDIYVNVLKKAFSERKLDPTNVVIHTAGDSAWLVFDWTFTANPRTASLSPRRAGKPRYTDACLPAGGLSRSITQYRRPAEEVRPH